MKNKVLKVDTLVLFNEAIYQINGYSERDNMYYIGTKTENIHFEPIEAFIVIRLGDKLLM